MLNHPRKLATIIVPCYNEALRLDQLKFRKFIAKSDDICFIFVNDGSKDNTLEVLEGVANGYPNRVFVIDKQPNGGKGEAVRHGMQEAMRRNETELIGFWDADLATPLDAIYELTQVFMDHPEIQMVFGARVKLLGREIQRRATRHYLGRIFATVVSMLLDLPIYDTQCGAKLFRASPGLSHILTDPFSSRWIFDVELLARFICLHAANRETVRALIYEVPLHSWRDVAGSKLKPTDFIRALRDVLLIYRRYLA